MAELLTKFCKHCQREFQLDDIAHWSKAVRHSRNGQIEYTCKVRKKRKSSEYIKNNKRAHAARNKKWAQENRSRLNYLQSEYSKKPERKFGQLKTAAKGRQISVDLTFEEYLSLTDCNECFYCGSSLPIKGHGLDRLFPKLGYSVNNCVPCCTKCNYAKHKMTQKEFCVWVIKVYNHFIVSGGL